MGLQGANLEANLILHLGLLIVYLHGINDMQTTSHILMVKPNTFGFNPETGSDNLFQKDVSADIQTLAETEFLQMVETLRKAGVNVTVANAPSGCNSPDAVFPNNWLSFHGNRAILYPMMAENRRTERNLEIVESLSPNCSIIDLTHYESESTYLEGTGSLVLDRVNKIAYASLSHRTEERLVDEFCSIFSYKPLVFRSYHNGNPDESAIYHTNVMLSVGSQLAICCFESVPDKIEKTQLRDSLTQTGKKILELSLDQMGAFAGNMLEVQNSQGDPLMVMSETARKSLSQSQLELIESGAQIVSVSIPTIESVGGGSARCMMAEVFC